MFDFSEIKLVKNPNDNFVGIRKSQSGDDYEFWLPNGFDDFPEGDFDKVRELFFKMYRTFRKFENDNKPSRVNINRPDYQEDQDQTTVSSGGLSLQTEEGEGCQLYSKLRMIERVLETYDDLAINSIQKKIKRTDDIDYSQIHKYLNRAIYLDYDENNRVIHVETMDLPRPVLRYESTDIVNLYCYVLDEIVQQLDEDVPDNVKTRIQDIRFLGQHFKDDYLTSEQSIFDKDTFLETTNILKDALDNIDKYTYYKDDDYWRLYEAIETFLYGELNPNLDDGEYWGIKGFSLIWEDMCNTYFFRNYRNQICFADTDIRLNSEINDKRQEEDINRVGNFCQYKWIYSTTDNQGLAFYERLCITFDSNIRRLVLTNDPFNNSNIRKHPDFPEINSIDNSDLEKMRRFLRPDLILITDKSRNGNEIDIVDYKDVPIDVYINPSSPRDYEKCKNDTIKQLTYELALQQTYTVVENKFFLPYYYETLPHNSELGKIGASLDNGIVIFQANFFLIQNQYLQENT